MASADAVFLAAHYRAVQRKTSESSTDEPPKRRSNSILDDIKDGVSKLTGTFSDKKKENYGRRRAMSEIATSGPTPSRGLVEDKRRQWSIKQKSIDAKKKEHHPEVGESDQPQQAHTYTSGKTAQDLINQKRGRLHSAPVQYGRPRSESDAVLPSHRFSSKKETTEEDPDDVFEEADEEELNHQQQQQQQQKAAHGCTRL